MICHTDNIDEALPGREMRRTALDAAFWLEQRKRMARRVHGFVASTKMNRPLHWRSVEEADLLRLLEVDARVDAIETCPERIEFVLDGAPRAHVAAIQARSGRRIVMLDALRHGERGSPARARLTAALTALYREAGIAYHAVARAAVRAEPRFSNALHVLAYRGYEPAGGEELRIIEALTRAGELSLAALERSVPGATTRAAACVMAMRSQLLLKLATASTPDAIGVSLWRLI